MSESPLALGTTKGTAATCLVAGLTVLPPEAGLVSLRLQFAGSKDKGWHTVWPTKRGKKEGSLVSLRLRSAKGGENVGPAHRTRQERKGMSSSS